MLILWCNISFSLLGKRDCGCISLLYWLSKDYFFFLLSKMAVRQPQSILPFHFQIFSDGASLARNLVPRLKFQAPSTNHQTSTKNTFVFFKKKHKLIFKWTWNRGLVNLSISLGLQKFGMIYTMYFSSSTVLLVKLFAMLTILKYTNSVAVSTFTMLCNH